MKLDKDIFGAFFSSLCLLHCLLTPVLLFLGISSVGLTFLHNEWFHYILIAPIMIFVVWSIPYGFKAHHKKLPPLFATVGVALFVLGLISSEVFEVYFTVLASALLIAAHLYNRHLMNIQTSLPLKTLEY